VGRTPGDEGVLKPPRLRKPPKVQKASNAGAPNAGAPNAGAPNAGAPSGEKVAVAHKRLGQILLDMGKITPEKLADAMAIKQKRGGAIGAVLVDLGYVNQVDISAALAVQAGMRRVDLDTMEIPRDVIDKMDAMTARSYSVVPIGFKDGKLTVAMSDPNNFRALDELHMLLDYEIEAAVADSEAVVRTLDKHYAQSDSVSFESVIGELGSTAEWIAEHQESIDLEDIRAMSESQPVKKLLNLVLLQAIRDSASDIHFEPFEDEFKMRYRIDGVLYEMVPPPRHIALAVASRIKVMANLDIAERRVPQDGRIELTVGGKPVDLRVSVLPTMFGESVVLRVLDRTQVELDITKVGLREDDQRVVDELIHLANGIVIVTGPTGCGKTTTLYSALSAINKVDVKIITTEDPVEYDVEGLIQVQVNPDIELTFARCLRHILRQDPDIILVGEIRDLETARIAIHASLTGHLVFSTLHTNDAPTATARHDSAQRFDKRHSGRGEKTRHENAPRHGADGHLRWRHHHRGSGSGNGDGGIGEGEAGGKGRCRSSNTKPWMRRARRCGRSSRPPPRKRPSRRFGRWGISRRRYGPKGTAPVRRRRRRRRDAVLPSAASAASN